MCIHMVQESTSWGQSTHGSSAAVRFVGCPLNHHTLAVGWDGWVLGWHALMLDSNAVEFGADFLCYSARGSLGCRAAKNCPSQESASARLMQVVLLVSVKQLQGGRMQMRATSLTSAQWR